MYHPDWAWNHFAEGQITKQLALGGHDLEEAVQTYHTQQSDTCVQCAVENGADVTVNDVNCFRYGFQVTRAFEWEDQGHDDVSGQEIFQVHHEGGGGLEV